uniref:Uncharacterized protein n=1 Tax=Romanomermis culicivorax TaxID=13658 RepID=A0A915L3G6_ROMCU
MNFRYIRGISAAVLAPAILVLVISSQAILVPVIAVPAVSDRCDLQSIVDINLTAPAPKRPSAALADAQTTAPKLWHRNVTFRALHGLYISLSLEKSLSNDYN